MAEGGEAIGVIPEPLVAREIGQREPRALLERLKRFEPAAIAPKWIDREET